jgi:hypothetical protein
MSQDMRTVPVDVQVAEHAMRAEADAIAEYLRALSHEVVRNRDSSTSLRLALAHAGLAGHFAPALERHYLASKRLRDALAEASALTVAPRPDGGLAVERAGTGNRALLLTDIERRGAKR